MGTVSDDGLHEGWLAPASCDGQHRYGAGDAGAPSDRTAVGAGPGA